MITVISGTHRNDSSTSIIAQKYCELLTLNALEHKLLDLRELPSDFIKADMFGNRTEKVKKMIEDFLLEASYFVFIVPEYHGSYPGIVKLFLDGIESHYFQEKKACLVGVASGRQGNSRGLDALGNVLNYLQVEVLSKKIKISGVDKLINKGELKDQETVDILNKQVLKMLDTWSIKSKTV